MKMKMVGLCAAWMGLAFTLPLTSALAAEVGTNDFRISRMGADGDVVSAGFYPSVAYNSVDDEYFVVWMGDDAVDGEFEIYGQRLSAATRAMLGAPIRISDMGPDGDAAYDAVFPPEVAYNSVENEYLVVWTGDDNTGSLVDGEYEVYGQRLDAATGAELGTNDFRISDMGPDGNTAFFTSIPSVAYNSREDEYLVVWSADDDSFPLVDNEYEIHGQRLDAKTGAELGANDFRISDMGTDGDTAIIAVGARVAYDAADDHYLVIWQGDDDTGSLIDGEYEVYGQLLDATTAAEIGTNDFRVSDLGPDGNTALAAQAPRLAYNSVNNEFLVVWMGSDTTFGSGNEVEVMGQRLDAATGAEIGENDFRISDMGPADSTAYWSQRPSVTYGAVNNEYLVLWVGDDDTVPLVDEEFEVFGQRLDAATGAEVGENDFRVSDMGPDGDTTFKADNTVAAFSSTHNSYLVLWDGDDDTSPLVKGESEIFGQFLNDPVCGNGVTDSIESCDDGNLADGDGCSSACTTEAPAGTTGGTTGDATGGETTGGTATGDDGAPTTGGCSLIVR